MLGILETKVDKVAKCNYQILPDPIWNINLLLSFFPSKISSDC